MEYEDVKVGMAVVETSTGDRGTVTSTICEYSETSVWVDWNDGRYWIEAEAIHAVQQPSLANTKIDVQKSADTPEPSVELGGKQYTKAQLLDALAKLEGK